MKSSERNTMQVRIYSPEGLVYDHQALSCSVRAVDGGMTLLPNHAPILVPLDISVVKVIRQNEGQERNYIAISGGVLEMRQNQIEIIANSAIRGRDIDENMVASERQKAEQDMQEALASHDDVAFKKAKIELDRAMNKISAVRRRSRYRK